MPTLDLNAQTIAGAKCQNSDRDFFWDSSLPGFALQVTASGHKSFIVQYRANGVSRRMKLKGSTLKAAKKEARIILGQVQTGTDPLAARRKERDARADTLRRIVEDEYFTNKSVKKLRSFAAEKRGTFRRYIFPALGSRPLAEIKRREIVRMLDRVAATNGPAAAGNAFRVLSAFFNWYAAGDDDFRSPIVKGTFKPEKGDGARTLTDDEIRVLWNVAGEGRSPYDNFLKFLLLTGTRLRESANMSRDELSADGTEWTIPASRYKGQDGKSAHAHLVPLSSLARDVLAGTRVFQVGGKDSMWVFTSDGVKPIAGFSNLKRTFDNRLLATLEREGDATRERIIAHLKDRYPGKDYKPFGKGWSPHSLRKTARCLLSRAGIDRDTAERCLGHAEGGIVATYNHHEYKPEKAAAFEALAREVEHIVSGPCADVIPITGVRR